MNDAGRDPERAARLYAAAREHRKKSNHPDLQRLGIELLSHALGHDPDHLEARLALVREYRSAGMTAEALKTIAAALERHPDSLRIRFVDCFARIPLLATPEIDIDEVRAGYERRLRGIAQDYDPGSDRQTVELAETAAHWTPFLLPFQGLDDTALQALYGSLVHRIVTADLARTGPLPPPVPRCGARDRIRVGFVFGHSFSHSVWKVIASGWVSGLDPGRFELHGYFPGTKANGDDPVVARAFTSTVFGDRSTREWYEIIAGDRPDILVYPEIGLSMPVTRLACLRIAPAQCVSWGNSITTGIPTLDYYLSADDMEPTDAREHYTERLVRLDNLSIDYSPPGIRPDGSTRRDFGIRDGATLFLCPQSLFKCQPRFVHLLPEIARGAGDCQFVFLRDKRSSGVSSRFRAWLRGVFAGQGVDDSGRIVMLPTLSDAGYHAINALADIHLDTIGWSGGTTTLEALAYAPAIVTLPGGFFRGRMTAAILARAGVADTIARDDEDYVAIAVRLARDATFRRDVKARMATGIPRVYGDRESVRSLERFLVSAVQAAGRKGPVAAR